MFKSLKDSRGFTQSLTLLLREFVGTTLNRLKAMWINLFIQFGVKTRTRTTAKFSAGFTLIELLVVIAIIGLLSSVVLASLNSARQKSRDARRISDVKQLQTALELYYDDQTLGGYPDALSSLETGGYIPSVPTDPRTNGSYLYDNLNNADAACSGAGCTSYGLAATLENSTHPALNSSYNTTVLGTVPCTTAGVYCVKP